MIVFLDSKGSVTATAPSTTGRNSAAMSTIYIVAPISGAVMSLSFRLPNGDEVNPDLADAVHDAVEILKGVDLPAGVHVWTYAIPKSVTAISGTVMYTITTTTESFVATGSGTFVVAPATTKTLPSSAPGVDVWEDILAELSRIYAEMETVIGSSPVTGLDGLTTTVTALISEIAALIGNEPIESPIGGATTISTLLGWLKDESVRFSEVIGGGSISFSGSLIEAVNTLREISVVKTDTPSRVYATASDGTPAFLPYAETPTSYSVPQRDVAGRVKTASPASASDAVDFGTFSAEKERVGKLIDDLQTAVNRLSRAFAFDNWEAALVELNKYSLEEVKEKYKIGDAILIRDTEAPDGWVSGYAVSPLPYPGGNNVKNPFDGTDAFTVGWLIISPLEAPKLSLDGYATTEEAKAFADAAESESKSYAAEEVAGVSERVDILDKEVSGVSERVDILDKKVENLRAALSPEYFETDASVAYIKTVPASALPFAEVQEVGGMSYAENGEIRNAAVTAIESVGKNLAVCTENNAQEVYGITITRTGGKSSVLLTGAIAEDHAARLFGSFRLLAGTYTASVVGLNASDCLYVGAGNDVLVNYVQTGAPKTFTVKEEKICFMQIVFANGSTYSNTKIKVQIEKGSAATEFAPYAKHSLAIPAEVQALEGWGWGTDAKNYNRLVWDVSGSVKIYRQEVSSIDLGALSWTAQANNVFYGSFAMIAPPAAYPERMRGVLVADYANSTAQSIADMPDKSILRFEWGVAIRDTAYTDAAAFVEAMHGKTMLYARKDPVVTDLPTVLGDDNFIEVEGGGTVTVVNENGLAAPTTIEYQLKEATA